MRPRTREFTRHSANIRANKRFPFLKLIKLARSDGHCSALAVHVYGRADGSAYLQRAYRFQIATSLPVANNFDMRLLLRQLPYMSDTAVSLVFPRALLARCSAIYEDCTRYALVTIPSHDSNRSFIDSVMRARARVKPRGDFARAKETLFAFVRAESRRWQRARSMDA